MRNIPVITGNIFTSTCQTIVNTVNCVGVMGAGLALECRLRYPDMYRRYVELCSTGKLRPGLLWLYKAPDRWILNFPTKQHWKYPSQESFLRDGLQKFMETYRERDIQSIAFPLLGARNGGLSSDTSLMIMTEYLSECQIPVEVYQYDPGAPDELFGVFRTILEESSLEEVRRRTGLRKQFIEQLRVAVRTPGICQLNQLATVKGVGDKSLEAAFALVRCHAQPHSEAIQAGLDL